MDAQTMDALTALRLQIEWGANEALETEPVDRLRPPPARVRSVAGAPVARSAILPQAEGHAAEGHAAAGAPIPGAYVPGAYVPGAHVPGTPAAGGRLAGRDGPAERAARAAGAATTLDELRAAIASFDGISLRDTATNMLFLEGDPTCGLLFVGEAPNSDADRSGSSFAGPVGSFMEQMLRSVGLDRNSICLVPLIPWRPPGDRPPSQTEIATCLPFLHRTIVFVAPRRIVALGPLPARALLGATPLRRRATPAWQDATVPGTAAPIPVLVMPSPAILLRVPAQRRNAWAGLRYLRHSLDIDLTQK
jgi:uracil-DNA glycosylase family 4